MTTPNFEIEFGQSAPNMFDLTDDNVKFGMLDFAGVKAWPKSWDFNSTFRYLDRKCNYLHGMINNMIPVGTVFSSFDPAPFNQYFLSLNGELISSTARPKLYAKLLAAGFIPDVNNLIKLPDMRGTVMRAQNKGRFSDVDEVALGQYQADATQRVLGGAERIKLFRATIFSGALTLIHAGAEAYEATSGEASANAILSFDNSRVVRTAQEDRVKATFAHFQIFAGIED